MSIIQGVNYVPGRSNISTTSNIKKNAETRETIFQKIYFLRGMAPPHLQRDRGGARGVENLKWQHRANGGSFNPVSTLRDFFLQFLLKLKQ